MKKIINKLFFLIFSLIFIGGMIMNKSHFKNAEILPLLFSFLVFLTFFIFIYKKFDEKIENISKKTEIISFVIISLIIVILECIYGYYLRSNGGGWDFYVIIRAAYNIANNIEMHYDDIIYFQVFPQNRFMVVVLAMIYKIFSLINIKDKLIPGIVMNILITYLSFVFLYLIIRKLYDKKMALFMLASTIFLSPIFLYIPIFYTDTVSMLFIMFEFFIYLCYNNNPNQKQKFIFSLLMGISIFFGMLLKVTTVFIGIALLIELLLNRKIKENFEYVGIVIYTIIIMSLLYNSVLNKSKIFPFDLNDKTYKMPYIHWIMMGINTQESPYEEGEILYGTWNKNDYIYTLTGEECGYDKWKLMDLVKYSPFNYNEKYENARNRLNDKIKELGFCGIVKYLYLKMLFIFGDGTYYIPVKISLDVVHKDCLFTSFFRCYGENFDLYFYISQGIYFSFLFLVLLSVCINMKEQDNKLIICRIAMLELVAFLLIWEARSRYTYNYILIFYIQIIPILKNISKKEKQ